MRKGDHVGFDFGAAVFAVATGARELVFMVKLDLRPPDSPALCVEKSDLGGLMALFALGRELL